ncbi:MAG: hypothetical protein PHV89_07750 [Fermentimonas sp.]|nr:hypothetical protein [Fermentimonas sp.]MDD4284729.1 hypothetical protein [Fermentimonas sp.]MDD4724655.1 hypothetical protein [Fermentimonas sp.]NLC86301.1 hypothetical protein [Bacteroidales bacterium]
MIIAVDFDGTIVEHEYPAIGKPIPFAIETLLHLQRDGHKLIMWTVRRGSMLQDAVDYCAAQGLYFYAENENYRGETIEKKEYSRKLKADLFIDDRNLGGLPDWGVIYNAVKEMESGGGNALSIMAGKTERPTFKKKKWGLF